MDLSKYRFDNRKDNSLRQIQPNLIEDILVESHNSSQLIRVDRGANQPFSEQLYEENSKSKNIQQPRAEQKQTNISKDFYSRIQSEFVSEYHQLIATQLSCGSENQDQNILQNIMQRLTQKCKDFNTNIDNEDQFSNYIRYKPNKIKQFQIKQIKTTQNAQVVVFKIELGDFQVYVSMLNVLSQTPCQNAHQQKTVYQSYVHQLPKIGSGTFGTVYSVPNSKYAIKCLQFQSSRKQKFCFQKVRQILYEIAFLKLIRMLKIGPQLKSLFGFDIIHYPNCIQFSMQKCLSPMQIQSTNVFTTLNSDLFQIMIKLHFLNICHCDIKPYNVMYCSSLKKWIFIDYGLAHILNEQIGFKTLSNFVGTYQYSSQEMKKIVYRNDKDFVDLYYNDLHALTKTLKELKSRSLCPKQNFYHELNYMSQSNQCQNQAQQNQQHQQFQCLIKTFKLMYLLYSKKNYDYSKFDKLILQNESLFRYWQGLQVVKFLLQLEPSDDIAHFINKYIRNKTIDYKSISLDYLIKSGYQYIANFVYSEAQKMQHLKNEQLFKRLFKIYCSTKITTYLLPIDQQKYSLNMKRIKGVNQKRQTHSVHQNSIIILSYLQKRNILLAYGAKGQSILKWDFYYCLIDYFLCEKIRFYNKNEEFGSIKQKLLIGDFLWHNMQKLNPKNKIRTIHQQVQEKLQEQDQESTSILSGILNQIHTNQPTIKQMIYQFQKSSQKQTQRLKINILQKAQSQLQLNSKCTSSCLKLFSTVLQYLKGQFQNLKEVFRTSKQSLKNPLVYLSCEFYVKNQEILIETIVKLACIFQIFWKIEEREQTLNLLKVSKILTQYEILTNPTNFIINPIRYFQIQLTRLYLKFLSILNFYHDIDQAIKQMTYICEQIKNYQIYSYQKQNLLDSVKEVYQQFMVLLEFFKKIIQNFYEVIKGVYKKHVQQDVLRLQWSLLRLLNNKNFNFQFNVLIVHKYQFLCNFILSRLYRLCYYQKCIQYGKKCQNILKKYKYSNFQRYLINSVLISSTLSLKNWKQAKLIEEKLSCFLTYQLQICQIQFSQKKQYKSMELCIDLILLKHKLKQEKEYFHFLTTYAFKTKDLVKTYPKFIKYFDQAKSTVQKICQVLKQQQAYSQCGEQNNQKYEVVQQLLKDPYCIYQILIQWYWYHHQSHNKSFDFEYLLQTSLKSRSSPAKIMQLKAILTYQKNMMSESLQCMFNCGQFMIDHTKAIGESLQTCINVIIVIQRQLFKQTYGTQIKSKCAKISTNLSIMVFQYIYDNQFMQKIAFNLQITKIILQVLLNIQFQKNFKKPRIDYDKSLSFIFISLSQNVQQLKTMNLILIDFFIFALKHFFEVLLSPKSLFGLYKSQIIQKLIINVLQRYQSKSQNVIFHKRLQKCSSVSFYLWYLAKQGYQFLSILSCQKLVFRLVKSMQGLTLKQKQFIFKDYYQKIGLILQTLSMQNSSIKVHQKKLQKYHFKYNQNMQTQTAFYKKTLKKLNLAEFHKITITQFPHSFEQIKQKYFNKLYKYSFFN